MRSVLLRLLKLSYDGFSCSQILVLLALEARGTQNPELVRAVGGLAFGGGNEAGPCGALTGAACVLSLFAGKGSVEETECEELSHMLRELGEWFELEVGQTHGGISCGCIVGDGTDRKRRCGEVVRKVHEKTCEILHLNGFALAEESLP